jgi:SNF2 family DNA or RNA helicase
VVVTTYGTLRRDVQLLSRISFAHAILDEAQTIKNAGSQAAKAARLLRADHRIALTGTPVENHLDDLWSIFEFLNPGMLGKSQVFRGLTRAASSTAASTRALARALRPFLLRRTKEQVLADLPPKIEQVVACDLEGAERKRYDELRDHYRASLLARVDGEGLDRARMHVLEALLRLRQAACHPGLIDRTRTGEHSAKLDALLPMLEEVRESGHKALVFSQFTSFLAIVRDRLDAADVTYEYLDGKTKDREERVRRFQEDERCSLFLISLKAGGFGLNLASADYVFLLDPWWNPAVERQAIDRTHRIGQTRTVNAYRLVARGTIEEKVIELQAKKRELAEAILGETDGTLRDLTREDLERLLS